MATTPTPDRSRRRRHLAVWAGAIALAAAVTTGFLSQQKPAEDTVEGCARAAVRMAQQHQTGIAPECDSLTPEQQRQAIDLAFAMTVGEG